MSISDTGAALIGAGIGAGGAIVAQVIASVFAARKDERRFQWERSQAAHTRATESEKMHADAKRAVCVQYLRMCSQRFDLLHRAWVAYEVERARAHKEADQTSGAWWSELGEVREELVLFDPSLEEPARRLMAVLAEWESDLIDEGYDGSGEQMSTKYGTAVKGLSSAMRASLGLDKQHE